MNNNKTVLVLDAGGTNLVFNAVQNGVILNSTFSLPAKSKSLKNLLEKILQGFREINQRTGNNAAAISFCFPGPADFEKGIIGDLQNLPFFRGGVPLKTMLEHKFKLPVFINNDGDLFTLGEAIGGLLPEVNNKLKENKVEKHYNNLLGVTLGTGFGGGIVSNGHLFLGDNSSGAEINRMVNPLNWEWSIEEDLSIRGIKRLYSEELSVNIAEVPEPYSIFKIGMGETEGDQNAAKKAWEKFGLILGDAMANAVTMIDGLVVIGGGLSGAYPLFLPKALEMMNRRFLRFGGGEVPRMEIDAYNLEDINDSKSFYDHKSELIDVPFSKEQVLYIPDKKTAVGVTRLGTSRAVAVGAYAFAAEKLGFN